MTLPSPVPLGRFLLDANLPEEYMGRLVKMLTALDPMMPNWCTSAIIDYDTNLSTSTAAEVTCRYDYRRVWISLAPKFFAERSVQWSVLVHEVCHIYQEPLWDMMNNLRALLKDLSPHTNDFMQELGRHTREQTVSDMTEMFLRLYPSPFTEEDV